MQTTDQAHTYDQIELGNRPASGLYFEAESIRAGSFVALLDQRANEGARY